MHDAETKANLRSRYRHQPTRRIHKDASKRRYIAQRPHASQKNTVDSITAQQHPTKKTPHISINVDKNRYRVAPETSFVAPPRYQYEALLTQLIKQKYTLAIKYAKKYIQILSDPQRRDQLIAQIRYQMRHPQSMLLAGAGLVFVLGLTVSIMGFRANSHVEAQAAQVSQRAASGDDTEDLDETNPGARAVANYKVAPDAPKRISIPKIQTNSRIKALGVKSNNQLEAPTNIYDTGWYQQSAKPGQEGAMLLDGHVHGPRKPGVFHELKKLSPGDKIIVERGDGMLFTYSVVKTKNYPANSVDMTAALASADPEKQGLNIITCSGSLNSQRTGYKERLVVFAVRD